MQNKDRVSLHTLWHLFTAFFRIGLFTFGGGYAMLPLFEKEVVDKYKWSTREEIVDIYALAQTVPGVIAVNTSMFFGNRLAGIPGACAAAAGVIAPSLVVIITIALFFLQIQANPYVMAAFSGIRAAVAGLIAAAALRIGLASIRDTKAFLLALTSLVLILTAPLHAAWIILGGALGGLLLYYRPGRKEGNE